MTDHDERPEPTRVKTQSQEQLAEAAERLATAVADLVGAFGAAFVDAGQEMQRRLEERKREAG